MSLTEFTLERSREGILTAKEPWLESVIHPEKVKSQRQSEVRDYVRSISESNEQKAEIIALQEQAQRLYEEFFSLHNAQAATTVVDFQLEHRFRKLADEWISETIMFSDPIRIFMHRAHFKIIGMGEKALPLILKEVEKRSADWFIALESISVVNPVQPNETTFEQAAEAWLRWGKSEGLI